MNRLVEYGDGLSIAERIDRGRDAFETVNIDMIFRHPGQSLGMLRKDVLRVKESLSGPDYLLSSHD